MELKRWEWGVIAAGLLAAGTVGCASSSAEPNSPESTSENPAAKEPQSEDEALAEQIAAGDMGADDMASDDPAEEPAADSTKASSEEEDTRTTETMAKVVQANRHLFRACYEKVQKDIPNLKGDIVITFVVSPQGSVTKSVVNDEASTLKNKEVGQCCAEEMKKLTFSQSSRGMESEVNYPFNFNPR